MDTKVLTPQEVHTLLSESPEAIYIDVRTVAEFATGHPKGRTVNIPIVFFHPTSHETFPNNSFLQVMEDLYAKDTPLIAGCDDGERAKQAASQLQEAGYTDVMLMPDGFPGWRKQKLPATTDNRDGISYASLLTRVKRKGKKKAVH